MAVLAHSTRTRALAVCGGLKGARGVECAHDTLKQAAGLRIAFAGSAGVCTPSPHQYVPAPLPAGLVDQAARRLGGPGSPHASTGLAPLRHAQLGSAALHDMRQATEHNPRLSRLTERVHSSSPVIAAARTCHAGIQRYAHSVFPILWPRERHNPSSSQQQPFHPSHFVSTALARPPVRRVPPPWPTGGAPPHCRQPRGFPSSTRFPPFHATSQHVPLICTTLPCMLSLASMLGASAHRPVSVPPGLSLKMSAERACICGMRV